MAKNSFQGASSLSSASAKLVLGNFPFVLFLGFLATIYIANSHYAEGQVRDIQTLKREVRELERKYNSLQAELMSESRHSRVARRVKELGLKKTDDGFVKIDLEE